MSEIRQPLWFKLSVDFYDHPKVFTLSIHERELYQRAICYSRRHLTDGFLSRDTLRQLGKPLVSDLCECIRKGRHWEEVCDCWIEVLAKVALLDRIDENFLQVHGFLDWNPSRSHVESITSMRRKYGSKGGKLKHINMLDVKQNAKQNASKHLANGLAKVYPETETETETENKRKSSASQVQKPAKPPTISFHEKRKLLEDFLITDDIRVWARNEFSIEIPDDVLNEFKDHWRKEPDKKLRTDWTATFQSNVRKLVSWGVLKKTLPSQNTSPANGSYHKKVVL